MDKNTTISLVAPDGKVRYVPSYMKDELIAKGWRIVINPKREYYPELDKSLKSNTTPNVLENVEEGDILEVEKI